jgi:hypothetical protein
MQQLFLKTGAGLSSSKTPIGDTLEIEVFYGVPSGTPPNNKGVVFGVSGSTVTIYVWDGSTWIAK